MSYRELIVWQKAMLLAESAYAVARALPQTERFGLSAQLCRCAVSVPSNIAEGHERRSRADYRRFVVIACGSLAELETQLDLVFRLHSIDRALLDRAHALADEVGRLLRSIERSLRIPAIAEDPAEHESAQPSALIPQP